MVPRRSSRFFRNISSEIPSRFLFGLFFYRGFFSDFFPQILLPKSLTNFLRDCLGICTEVSRLGVHINSKPLPFCARACFHPELLLKDYLPCYSRNAIPSISRSILNFLPRFLTGLSSEFRFEISTPDIIKIIFLRKHFPRFLSQGDFPCNCFRDLLL